MKEMFRRGGAIVLLVILIFSMTILDGARGHAAMVHSALINGILVLFGAGIIADIYQFIHDTKIIIVSPRTLITTILSIAALLVGMQGLWNTVWDIKDGPVTYELDKTHITWTDDHNPLHLDQVYAVYEVDGTTSRIRMDHFDQYDIAKTPNDQITLTYWEHSKKVYAISEGEKND